VPSTLTRMLAVCSPRRRISNPSQAVRSLSRKPTVPQCMPKTLGGGRSGFSASTACSASIAARAAGEVEAVKAKAGTVLLPPLAWCRRASALPGVGQPHPPRRDQAMAWPV